MLLRKLGGIRMNWYDKLNKYFPEHEMKKQEHLEDLIEDNDNYHKEETEDYLVLYAEFPDFIFIDYILVTSKSRGRGIGSSLLDRFKAKKKVILLEVEPPDIEDVNTEKRMEFYLKNEFKIANHIQYKRKDEDGDVFTMNILYWPADETSQRQIMSLMAKACAAIHNYRSRYYYGREVANPDQVLDWIE